jgi:hypothetical protein
MGGQAPLSGFVTTGTEANKEEEARHRVATAKISFFMIGGSLYIENLS